jgi:hypothetical protein
MGTSRKEETSRDWSPLDLPEGKFTKIGAVAGVIGVVIAIAVGIHWWPFSSSTSSTRAAPPTASSSVHSPSPTSSPTLSPTPSPISSSSEVWHQGELVLNSGQEADLDSPPSDSHWGLFTENDDPGTGLDISWDANNGLERSEWGLDVQLLLLPNHNNKGDVCASAQGYISTSTPQPIMPPSKIAVGSQICVYTTGQRYSLLTVEAIKPDYSAITFDVVTFKNAND